jgi:CheY-like chemotaxis protein
MATILLIEDSPDLGLYEAHLLEAEGHRIIRCGGAPTVLAACPMLRYGSCPLPDSADLILFSSALFVPARGRNYRGIDLVRAYRNHAAYGRLPMLLVTIGSVDDPGGNAPFEIVEKFSPPQMIVDAVDRLLGVRAAAAAIPS